MAGVAINVTADTRNADRQLSKLNQNLAVMVRHSADSSESLRRLSLGGLQKGMAATRHEAVKTTHAMKGLSSTTKKSLSEAGGGIDSLTKGLGRLKSMVVGAGAAFLALRGLNAFQRAADDLTLIQNKLRLTITDAKILRKTQEDLFMMSRRTYMSFGGTADTYSKFAKSLEGAGIGAARLKRIVETVNKAAVMSGSSVEAVNQALVQLNQGISSGYLRGEEFNSVAEQLMYLSQGIADSMGVTRGELRRMAGEGLVTADVVVKAIERMADRTDKDFQRVSITVARAVEQLKMSVSYVMGNLNQSMGLSNRLGRRIASVAEYITEMPEKISTAVTLSLYTIGNYVHKLKTELLPKLVLGKAIADRVGIVNAIKWGRELQELRVKLQHMKAMVEPWIPEFILMKFRTEPITQLEREMWALQRGLDEKAAKKYAAKLQKLDKLRKGNGVEFMHQIDDRKEAAFIEASAKYSLMQEIGQKRLAQVQSFGMTVIKNLQLTKNTLKAVLPSVDKYQKLQEHVSERNTLRDFVTKDAALAERYLPKVREWQGIMEKMTFGLVGDTRYQRAWVDVFRPSENIDELTAKLRKLLELRKEAFEGVKKRANKRVQADAKARQEELKNWKSTTDRMNQLQRHPDKSVVDLFHPRIRLLQEYFSSLSVAVRRLYNDLMRPTVFRKMGTLYANLRMYGKTARRMFYGTFNEYEGRRWALNLMMVVTKAYKALDEALRGQSLWQKLMSNETFQKTLQGLKGMRQTLKMFFYGFFNEIWLTTKENVQKSDWYNVLVAKINDLKARVVTAFHGIWDPVKEVHSEAVSRFTDMLERIDTVTHGRLRQVVEAIAQFGESVKAVFYDVWDKVVGHSYWPDTIDGVTSYTDRLQEALAKVQEFARKSLEAFKNTSDGVRRNMGDIPEAISEVTKAPPTTFQQKKASAIEFLKSKSPSQHILDAAKGVREMFNQVAAGIVEGSRTLMQRARDTNWSELFKSTISRIGASGIASAMLWVGGPLMKLAGLHFATGAFSTGATKFLEALGPQAVELMARTAQSLTTNMAIGIKESMEGLIRLIPEVGRKFVDLFLPDNFLGRFIKKGTQLIGNDAINAMMVLAGAISLLFPSGRRGVTNFLFGKEGRNGQPDLPGIFTNVGDALFGKTPKGPSIFKDKNALRHAIGAFATAGFEEVSLLQSSMLGVPLLIKAFVGDMGAGLIGAPLMMIRNWAARLTKSAASAIMAAAKNNSLTAPLINMLFGGNGPLGPTPIRDAFGQVMDDLRYGFSNLRRNWHRVVSAEMTPFEAFRGHTSQPGKTLWSDIKTAFRVTITEMQQRLNDFKAKLVGSNTFQAMKGMFDVLKTNFSAATHDMTQALAEVGRQTIVFAKRHKRALMGVAAVAATLFAPMALAADYTFNDILHKSTPALDMFRDLAGTTWKTAAAVGGLTIAYKALNAVMYVGVKEFTKRREEYQLRTVGTTSAQLKEIQKGERDAAYEEKRAIADQRVKRLSTYLDRRVRDRQEKRFWELGKEGQYQISKDKWEFRGRLYSRRDYRDTRRRIAYDEIMASDAKLLSRFEKRQRKWVDAQLEPLRARHKDEWNKFNDRSRFANRYAAKFALEEAWNSFAGLWRGPLKVIKGVMKFVGATRMTLRNVGEILSPEGFPRAMMAQIEESIRYLPPRRHRTAMQNFGNFVRGAGSIAFNSMGLFPVWGATIGKRLLWDRGGLKAAVAPSDRTKKIWASTKESGRNFRDAFVASEMRTSAKHAGMLLGKSFVLALSETLDILRNVFGKPIKLVVDAGGKMFKGASSILGGIVGFMTGKSNSLMSKILGLGTRFIGGAVSALIGTVALPAIIGGLEAWAKGSAGGMWGVLGAMYDTAAGMIGMKPTTAGGRRSEATANLRMIPVGDRRIDFSDKLMNIDFGGMTPAQFLQFEKGAQTFKETFEGLDKDWHRNGFQFTEAQTVALDKVVADTNKFLARQKQHKDNSVTALLGRYSENIRDQNRLSDKEILHRYFNNIPNVHKSDEGTLSESGVQRVMRRNHDEYIRRHRAAASGMKLERMSAASIRTMFPDMKQADFDRLWAEAGLNPEATKEEPSWFAKKWDAFMKHARSVKQPDLYSETARDLEDVKRYISQLEENFEFLPDEQQQIYRQTLNEYLVEGLKRHQYVNSWLPANKYGVNYDRGRNGEKGEVEKQAAVWKAAKMNMETQTQWFAFLAERARGNKELKDVYDKLSMDLKTDFGFEYGKNMEKFRGSPEDILKFRELVQRYKEQRLSFDNAWSDESRRVSGLALDKIRAQATALNDSVQSKSSFEARLKFLVEMSGDSEARLRLLALKEAGDGTFEAYEQLADGVRQLQAELSATPPESDQFNRLRDEITAQQNRMSELLKTAGNVETLNKRLESSGLQKLSYDEMLASSETQLKELESQLDVVTQKRREFLNTIETGQPFGKTLDALREMLVALRLVKLTLGETKMALLNEIMNDESASSLVRARRMAEATGKSLPLEVVAAGDNAYRLYSRSEYLAAQANLATARGEPNAKDLAKKALDIGEALKAASYDPKPKKEKVGGGGGGEKKRITLEALLGSLNETGIQLSKTLFANIEHTSQRALAYIGAQIEKMDHVLSEMPVDKLAGNIGHFMDERMKLLRKARDIMIEAVHTTASGITEGLSRIGVSDVHLTAKMSVDQLKEALRLDKELLKLNSDAELKRSSSPEEYLKDKKRQSDALRAANRMAEKINLTVASSFGAINDVFGSSLEGLDLSWMGAKLTTVMGQLAIDLKHQMEDVYAKGGELSEETAEKYFATFRRIARSGEFLNVFAEMGRAIESSLTDGVRKGFETVNKVVEELNFDGWIGIDTGTKRRLMKETAEIEAYKKALELPDLTQSMADILSGSGTLSEVMESFREEWFREMGTQFSETLKTPTEKNTAALERLTEVLERTKNLVTGEKTSENREPVTRETREAAMPNERAWLRLESASADAMASLLKSESGDRYKAMALGLDRQIAIGASPEQLATYLKLIAERVSATQTLNTAMMNGERTEYLALQVRKADDAVKRFADNLKSLQERSVEAGNALASTVGGSIRDAFTSLLTGESSWKEASTKMLDTVTKQIVDTFISGLTDPLIGENGQLYSALRQVGSYIYEIFSGMFGGSGAKSGSGFVDGISGGIGSFMGFLKDGFSWLGSKFGFAEGGHIRGPGTGTSDSILMFGSNGEFMVNAKSTAKYRPLLEAINQDRLPKFAEGGMIGGGSVYQFSNASSAMVSAVEMTGGYVSQLGDAVNGVGDRTRDMGDALKEYGEKSTEILGDGFKEVGKGMTMMGQGVRSGFSQVGVKMAEAMNPGKFNWLGAGLAILSAGLSLYGGGGSPGKGLGGGLKMPSGGGLKLPDFPSLRMAEGGHIRGPGTGTSDSILSWVSNGEFITNAAATAKHRPLLEAINAGRPLPRYATGGYVAPTAANGDEFFVAANSRGGASIQKFEINVTGDVSRQTRLEIQRMIPNIASGVNDWNKSKIR